MDVVIDWMQQAMEQARVAYLQGDVPVGAVIVKDDRVISMAYNRREIDGDPTAHAELIAIRQAAHEVGGWRLTGATIFVTLEPCVMCAGAIVLSRLDRVVFGAVDPKAGAVSSLYRVLDDQRLNHRVEVESGILASESADLLKKFFRERRNKTNNR